MEIETRVYVSMLEMVTAMVILASETTETEMETSTMEAETLEMEMGMRTLPSIQTGITTEIITMVLVKLAEMITAITTLDLELTETTMEMETLEVEEMEMETEMEMLWCQ